MTTVRDHRDLVRTDTGPGQFPDAPYTSAAAYFDDYSRESAKAAASVDVAELDRAAAILLEAYQRDSQVFTCGNGGSAAIANHLQCDHVKGVGNGTDLSPRVLSLSANVEVLTAIANDHAYDDVFAHQLRALGRPGDVLIAISSSGRSANIVRALTWASEHDVRTIALTGFSGGQARLIADVTIHVDGSNYGIVEDQHQAIMHTLAQYIRQSRMSAEAVIASVF
jgi:phosphoheptose isomerase